MKRDSEELHAAVDKLNADVARALIYTHTLLKFWSQ